MNEALQNTVLLKHDFLKNNAITEYLTKNKKLHSAVECLLLAEQGNLLQRREGVLQHQNTNKENYPVLLKDFLSDVNKSVSHIINSLQLVKNDDTLSSLLNDAPVLIGHPIEIMADEVVSLRIKNISDGYFKWLNDLCQGLFSLMTDVKEGKVKIDGLIQSDIDRVLDFIPKISSVYKRMHPLMIKNRIGKNISKIDLDSIVGLYPDAVKAIKHIQEQEDSIFRYLRYSVNLFDEKITSKGDLIYLIKVNGAPLEFISKNSVKANKKSSTLNFSFDCEFSIAFYLKKTILECATQKEILPLMCSIKDYFSRDRFIKDIGLRGDSYNKTHPFNIQNVAKSKFDTSVEALWDSFLDTKRILQEKRASLENVNYSFEEWKTHLGAPKLFYGYKPDISSGDTFSFDGIEKQIEVATRIMLNRIFEKRVAEDDSSGFLKTINEEYFIREVILNFLDYMYDERDGEYGEIGTSLFGYHERSTFHSTLKDSIVIDFRNNADGELNSFALAMFDKEERFSELVDAMRVHPYHNYYEIDKDAFGAGSEMSVSYLIDYLRNASVLSPSTVYRCGFKLRKLGNYKALGIYFSHTKTMGIDFRVGKYSYVHELAHHIDLNGYKKDRNKMIGILYAYFQRRITQKTEYYLRDEELIARGAEVAMVLMASNYTSLSSLGMPSQLLLQKLRESYASSKQRAYMKPWEEYFPKEMYLDIESLILKNDTSMIDIVLEYFESYWSERVGTNALLKDLAVDYNFNTGLKYPTSQRSYDYYHCSIYDIVHEPADKDVFLDGLIFPLFSYH